MVTDDGTEVIGMDLMGDVQRDMGDLVKTIKTLEMAALIGWLLALAALIGMLCLQVKIDRLEHSGTNFAEMIR